MPCVFLEICVLPTMLFSQAFIKMDQHGIRTTSLSNIVSLQLQTFVCVYVCVCVCVCGGGGGGGTSYKILWLCGQNCRQQQYFPSWSLIFGLSWSGLIEADRSRDRTHFGNSIIMVCCFHSGATFSTQNFMDHFGFRFPRLLPFCWLMMVAQDTRLITELFPVEPHRPPHIQYALQFY